VTKKIHQPLAQTTNGISAGLRGVTSASQRFARWRPHKLAHRLSADMLQQLTADRDDHQSVESTAALAFAGTQNSRRASTLGDRTAVDHRCSGGGPRTSHGVPRERWGSNAPGYPGFRRPFSRVIAMPEVGGIFPANSQAQTQQLPHAPARDRVGAEPVIHVMQLGRIRISNP
jgi:hypothetical protein